MADLHLRLQLLVRVPRCRVNVVNAVINSSSNGRGLVLSAGGALKQHLVQHWLQGMQDYRPLAPSYYETIILPHEGHSQWWADRSLTNDSTVTFPSIFWGGAATRALCDPNRALHLWNE